MLQGQALKELLQQLAAAAEAASSSAELQPVMADVVFARQVQSGWTSEAQQLVKKAHTAVLLRGVKLKGGGAV
jgi:hypothetical protein